MGIFYNPPQPPTANNAGTPAEPHVPVGTQGSQPPRYSSAVMLVAVLASWPTSTLEPRLQKPNDQQQRIAPLTLVYGQQPPGVGVTTPIRYSQSAVAWQPDPQPQTVRPQSIVQPFIPAAIVPGAKFQYSALFTNWPSSLARVDQTVNIAPLTLPVGDRPIVAAISSASMGAINASVAPTWPAQRSPQIAPLTLPTGDQPTVLSRQTALASAWASDWNTQSAPRSTAWNAAVTFVPYAPLQRTILSAWESTWAKLPALTPIAPLTLTYGDQPPVASLRYAGAWPNSDWPPQSASPSAGWNVAVVGFVPASPIQRALWSAWEPAWVAPPTPVKIAPLTLTYGDQPAPQRQAGSSWPAAGWPAQVAPSSAWNTLVIGSVSYTPLPKMLWTAWEPAPISISRPVAIAPLTLPTGDQPPVRGVASVNAALLASASAKPDNAAQSTAPNAGWNIPQPGTAPYAPLPRAIWSLWQPLWVQPPVPVSIAPLTLSYGVQVPVGPPKYTLIYGAWPADLEPRLGNPNERRQKIAPLTLVYGQQLIVGTAQVSQSVIAASWPLGLEPRLGGPNERQQKIAPLTLSYGDQVVVGTLSVSGRLIVDIWPLGLEPRLGGPNERRVQIAPLTLTYGQQLIVGTRAATRNAILYSWPSSLEPRLGYPNERQQKIATLNLVNNTPVGFRTTRLLLKFSSVLSAQSRTTLSNAKNRSMIDIGHTRTTRLMSTKSTLKGQS